MILLLLTSETYIVPAVSIYIPNDLPKSFGAAVGLTVAVGFGEVGTGVGGFVADGFVVGVMVGAGVALGAVVGAAGEAMATVGCGVGAAVGGAQPASTMTTNTSETNLNFSIASPPFKTGNKKASANTDAGNPASNAIEQGTLRPNSVGFL